MDGHNSYNSLDWEGTYIGMYPCNNCKEIVKRISLFEDMTFELSVEYIGSDKPNIENYTGNIVWSSDGSSIELISNGRTNIKNNKYKVGEKRLIPTDGSDNELRKLFSNKLTQSKWYLYSLNGNLVNQIRIARLKSAYIKFETEGIVIGQTRCNDFNGRFEVNGGNRISINDVIITKMACSEAEVEQQYIDLLSSNFIYRIEKDTMEFVNDYNNVLAKFILYK